MNINYENIIFSTYMLKTFFIAICTYFTILKIINENISNIKLNIKAIMSLFIISICVSILKYYLNSFIAIVSLIFLIAIIYSTITKHNLGYSILTSTISASFNYILFFLTITISYIINGIYPIYNDFINLCIIMVIHIFLLCKILKVKKLRNGISFFNKNSQDDYFDVIILNISVSILLSAILFPYIINLDILANLFVGFVILAIIMVITIYRTLQLYYKHKLLVRELQETKEELNTIKQEKVKLEQDNLNISKRIHTLAHKQKTLEYKMEQLSMKTETSEENNLKEKLGKLSKEVYKPIDNVELTKTGIQEIDDTLEYMKSECDKNNIEFNLQIIDNIYYMVNNLITTEELATLISDHVKDAIIAVNHTDNINKSILVKLGEIEESYCLYIYDSGVEFEKETLKHLGKEPYTTYKDEGGTGLGFMNTFETLHKYKASLIINEIGKTSKYNYTKVVMIKFDNKDEFKITSRKKIKNATVIKIKNISQ